MYMYKGNSDRAELFVCLFPLSNAFCFSLPNVEQDAARELRPSHCSPLARGEVLLASGTEGTGVGA